MEALNNRGICCTGPASAHDKRNTYPEIVKPVLCMSYSVGRGKSRHKKRCHGGKDCWDSRRRPSSYGMIEVKNNLEQWADVGSWGVPPLPSDCCRIIAMGSRHNITPAISVAPCVSILTKFFYKAIRLRSSCIPRRFLRTWSPAEAVP